MGRAWAAGLAAIFATLCFACSQFKVTSTMVYIIDGLGVSLATAGLLMTFSSVTVMLVALPGGAILQKLGSRKTLLAVIAFGILFNILGAVSPSFTLLAASRFLEGLCLGMITIVTPAVIAQSFPAEQRGLPMALFSLWVPAGMLCILNICNYVTPLYGWQANWWVVAALLGVALVICSFLVKDKPADQPQELPVAEAAETAASNGESDVAVLAEAANNGEGDGKGAGAGAGAGAGNGKGAPEGGSLWLRGMKSLGPWCLGIVFFAYSVGLGAYNTYFPTYLTQTFGMEAAAANDIMSVSMLAMMVVGLVWGVVMNKVPNRYHGAMLVASTLLYCVAMVVQFNLPSVALAVPVVVFVGVASQLVAPLIYDVLPDTVDPELVPVGMSITAFGTGLGTILTTIICGVFVEMFGTWSSLVLPLGAFGLIGVAASFVAMRIQRKRAQR